MPDSPRQLLIEQAALVVTMDDQRRELTDCAILIEDGVITGLGSPPRDYRGERLDASGCLITPGLINCHHHLYQSLTRCVPGGQDALLFGWLKCLYPIWARFTPDDFRLGVELGLAELALSGCSLSSDHQYLFPNGARLDDSIEAARSVGLRFLACRGAMSRGESDGGLPPDALVEREADILADSARLIDRWHDPAPGSMTQVALAPCSPFSVSQELMRDSALLARAKGVRLHTHLAENDEDVVYSLTHFGCRPGDYAEQLGWVGEDVWHAHCVKLDAREIALFARTGTGVAHCPCSNCRLGSGIAPLRALRDARVPVGLGVDGSASNDAAHLIGEARQALMLQRVSGGADAMSAREALEIATRGGAQTLGRLADLGSIEIGKRGDLCLWDQRQLITAGAWDPVAALILCGPQRVRDLVVEGRLIVRDGLLQTLDLADLTQRTRKAVARLAA